MPYPSVWGAGGDQSELQVRPCLQKDKEKADLCYCIRNDLSLPSHSYSLPALF